MDSMESTAEELKEIANAYNSPAQKERREMEHLNQFLAEFIDENLTQARIQAKIGYYYYLARGTETKYQEPLRKKLKAQGFHVDYKFGETWIYWGPGDCVHRSGAFNREDDQKFCLCCAIKVRECAICQRFTEDLMNDDLICEKCGYPVGG
jgi:hypothetical protein